MISTDRRRAVIHDGSSRRGTIIGVVSNPAADNGKGRSYSRRSVDYLYGRCRELGWRIVDVTGDSRESSVLRAREALSGLDALIVVGGDGMVSLGANVVADTDVPLGVIAVGSGNDFARCLGYPVGDVERCAEAGLAALYRGSASYFDLGHVVSAEDGGMRVNTFFAGMLNCSIDAAINDRANGSSLPFGAMRYMSAGIREVLHVRDYGFHVTLAGGSGTRREFDLVTPLLAVANARYIGGGIKASPLSVLDDGQLEMIWAKWHPDACRALRVLARAYRGSHLDDPLIGCERVASIDIGRGPQGDEPPILMADGEKVGGLPVRVDVHHKALRLLVPPGAKAVG